MVTDTSPLNLNWDISSPAVASCEALCLANPGRVARLPSASHPAVYSVSDVLFLGRLSQALCPVNMAGNDFCLLEESWSYDIESFPLTTLRSLALTSADTYRTLEEAAPLCFIWVENFWHWIFEGLTRVAVLESLGYRGMYIIPPHEHALETMVMMRIPRNRLAMGQQAYRIKRMFVTAHMAPDSFSPGMMQAYSVLKQHLDGAFPRLPGKKRCYIKRVGRRRIRNEQELTAMLEPMGFEVMTPEDYSSIDQFSYMSNVECSVMAHGANTALAFGQPRDSIFFELFGMGFVNNSNGPMADAAGLHHHQMTEKTAENVSFEPYGDFTVDVDFLHHRLRKILRL